MARRRGGGKRIGPGDVTGDQGIAFIYGVVAGMGFLWKPHGAPEAGIDGHIELRDNTTGEVHNAYVLVQSKAGKSYFKSETESSFEFSCDEDDLKYWMSGNVPVILVVSRNGTEGYWKSIKDYFGDPSKLATRRITFNKSLDRFDRSAQTKLIELAEPPGVGLHMSPIPKRERLFTNLVPLQVNRSSVFLGTTPISSEAEFDRAILSNSQQPPHWAVYEHAVTSFSDLQAASFRSVIDDGSVEEFSVEDFADPSLQARFIHLLHRCLQELLLPYDIVFHRRRELYFFESLGKGLQRSFSYQSIKEQTKRDVVTWKGSENGRFQPYCRHSAADIRFRCYDGEWFAEIVPSYIFTSDGYHGLKSGPSLMRGIKQLENNKAVVGQTLMWCDLLATDGGLLDDKTHPLTFGKVICEEVPFGIHDQDWLPRKEEKANANYGGDLFS